MNNPFKKLQASTWVHVAGFFIPFLLTVCLYLPSLSLGFFELDDKDYIIRNKWIQDLTAENLKFILTKPYFSNYSPLHMLSYAVDYAIAGLSPQFFRFSSILWGGLASGMVYLLAYTLTRKFWVALFAGLLFAAHPVHVESIVWISSRKDIIAALFASASMIAYLRYRQPVTKKWLWYAASILLFVLAEAGKQSVVVLPAIFIGYDVFVEKRFRLGTIVDKIPFALVAVGFAMAVFSAQPSRSPTSPFVIGHSVLENFWLLSGTGVYALNRHVPNPNTAGTLQLLGFSYLPVLLGLIPLYFCKRIKSEWLFLFYGVMLSLAPALLLSVPFPVTDRYLFFPSVLFCILAVWMLFSLLEKTSSVWKFNTWKFFQIGMTVLVLIFCVRTFAYIQEWKDPRSVWYRASQKTDSARAHMNFGSHYQDWAEKLLNHRADEESFDRFASSILDDTEAKNELIDEWKSTGYRGPKMQAFVRMLLNTAWDQYEVALSKKSPNLSNRIYLSRGSVKLKLNQFDAAEKEFITCWKRAQKNNYLPLKYEFSVRSFYALGVLNEKRGDLRKAWDFYRRAHNAQEQYQKLQAENPKLAYPGDWIPDQREPLRKLSRKIKQLEAEKGITAAEHVDRGAEFSRWAARLAGNQADPDALRTFLQSLSGDTDRVEALMTDWQMHQRQGKEIQGLIRRLHEASWDRYEKAVAKQDPDLDNRIYLRRGLHQMTFNRLDEAEKEFVTCLKNAQKLETSAEKFELSVRSLLALAIVNEKREDYQRARFFYERAANAQIQYKVLQSENPKWIDPGNWVGDLSGKIQQMDRIIAEQKVNSNNPSAM